MVAHKHIQAFLVLALAGPLVLSCGPGDSDNDSDDADTTDESDATDETDTTADTTDTTNDTTDDTTDTVEPSLPNSCDGPGDSYEEIVIADSCTTSAPPNCLINQFDDTYECTGGSEECWGDDTSLTGGSFTYTDGANDSTIETSLEDGFLSLTGESYSYSGFGMWFGPCLDASSWDGLEIQVTGDLGGGELVVQLQTDENYPIEDDKGACMFESEDSRWTDCANSQTALEAVTADGLAPIQLTWDQFSGGMPNDEKPDARQLRGIQLQFNCDEDTTDVPCVFDVQLLDLRWFKAEE